MWVVKVLNTDVHCLPVLVAVVVCVFALLLMVRGKPRRGKVSHRPFIKTRGRRPSPRITLLFGNREFPNGLTFTPKNSSSQPPLSIRSSPFKTRHVSNIPEKCCGNRTWPDVLTSANHSLKQKVPQPKKKKSMKEKNMKPRVLFASQSVHEKQVGSEEDKAELILQDRPKRRDNEHIEQAKTSSLCEPDPSLSSNVKESCGHADSLGKSISPLNTKIPPDDGQVSHNSSSSTVNNEHLPKVEAKIDTTRLSADVPKTGKPYEVKWDEQIKQAKTGILCEPDPSLSLNGKERCRHVHSQGKSISPSNTKVLLGDGQVFQNRSASTRNSELSTELNSKVGTICLPVDVTKREKPYQVKWDAKISRTPCERFSYFLTLRDVETNSRVSSEHGSSFVTFLPIGGHTCRQGQSQENLSSTKATTNTSLCQTLQTNDCHTDKVEHKVPESSQNTSAPDNREVDEIELMDLSWDNSDCFSGNSAGSRESSPLELIKEVSCSSDNSIGKSERKMRSSRKKAVKSHKREVVNFHCNNCDVSNDAAHLSKTQSSTEKNGKFPIQKPLTCNHKNSDANDVVAQASKSEVHCILCGIRLSKPQCFYSLGSLCTDDDICETTSDDINRHLVSDVDTNPPAGEGKGHPDTGYTSSEELENESVLPKEVEAILTHKRRRTDGYDGDHESDSSFESFVFTLSSSEDEREAVSVKEYVKQETNKRQEMAISQTIEKVQKLIAKAPAEKE